jgi:hypothetical protein
VDGEAQQLQWYRWLPASAESVAYADIAKAVEKFEPVDNPAGHAAEAWLKHESLASTPATVTHLAMLDGRLEGFYTIVSSFVKLNESDREELMPDYPLLPIQGASLVVWLAKRRDARVSGRKIMFNAVAMAAEVAKRQGTLACVLDPFDDATASMLKRRYRFEQSETEVRKGQLRLWVPLRFS